MIETASDVLESPVLAGHGDPATSADSAQSKLGIAIGDRHWLVDLSEAGEILPIPDMVAAVPGTVRWFKGLANLRGSLYGVSDLADFAGHGVTERNKDTRLLAFSPRLEVNAAILVSRMTGLQNMGRMTKIDSSAGDSWSGDRWQDAAGVTWQELHLVRLCRHEAFLSVGN